MTSKLKQPVERLLRDDQNELIVEHLHRYGLVLQLIEGKDVLDIASGEGYGSNLMADYAKSVIGVDIDRDIINHASTSYNKQNLKFIQGSADQIPLDDSSIDVIISFETIEHLDKQDEMLGEIRRVLRPEGVLIISSPEKSSHNGVINDYHIKELNLEDFKTLIGKYFTHTLFYYQKLVIGSLLVAEKENYGFDYLQGDFNKITLSAYLPKHTYTICIASGHDIMTLKSSFFDGQYLIENVIKDSLKNSIYYRFGAFLLSPLKRLRDILMPIKS